MQYMATNDQKDLFGLGNSKWMEEYTGYSLKTIKKKLLYPFRKELEGRIVCYPEKRQERWIVNKKNFDAWMQENWERIDW